MHAQCKRSVMCTLCNWAMRLNSASYQELGEHIHDWIVAAAFKIWFFLPWIHLQLQQQIYQVLHQFVDCCETNLQTALENTFCTILHMIISKGAIKVKGVVNRGGYDQCCSVKEPLIWLWNSFSYYDTLVCPILRFFGFVKPPVLI
jgi:hypothetical protein